MTYFEKLDLPTYENLYEELQDISVEWTNNQICMNAPKGKTDNPSFGVGRLLKEYKYGHEIEQSDVINQLKDGNWLLCDVFVGTQFEKVFYTVKEKYKIGRMRLMKSSPRSCLDWHQDPVPRIHYPIKTQEGCIMVIEDEVKHLAQNAWCLTQTTHSHTAVNASKEERVNIVADIFPR